MHNIVHLSVPAGYAVTPANATLISQAVGNLVATFLAGHMSTSSHFIGVSMRDLRTIDQPFVESTAIDVVGTAAGDPLPGNVSAVVTLRTALAGRRNRGRLFVIPLDEGSNDAGGRIAAAAKTALDSFAAGLMNAVQSSGGTMAILNRPLFNKADCTVLRQPGLVDVVTALIRDTRWDSQRRRLGKT